MLCNGFKMGDFAQCYQCILEIQNHDIPESLLILLVSLILAWIFNIIKDFPHKRKVC